MKDLSNSTTPGLRKFLLPEDKSLNVQKNTHKTKAEKRKAYLKKYRQEHKEQKKAYDKAYRQKPQNKEKQKARNKAYRQKKPEKIKAYREKNKEKIKADGKIYRLENKEKEKARHKAYQQKIREKNKWYFDLKLTLSCLRCGEKDPDCLDFHHINHKTKKHNICNMVKRKHFSREEIEAEMVKCHVLCANCHRKINSQRK